METLIIVEPRDVKALFGIGQLVVTPGALRAIRRETIVESLLRHITGDWGDLDEDDRRQNEQAVAQGGRVLSAFTGPEGSRFWIITEADRTVTSVLLPEEY